MSGERSRRSLAFRTAPAPPPPPPPALSPHCDPEASPPASTSVTCDQPTSAEAGGAEAALEASGSVGTDQDWVETVVVDDDYPDPEEVSVRVVDGGSISSNESEEEEEQEEEETAAAEVVEEIGEGERDEEFEGSDGGCGGMRLGSGLTLLGRPQSYLLPQRRTFQRSWLQEFPWLQYDQETGLMYCSWCLRSDGGDLHHNNRNKFVKGSRNYRRTTLLRHHLYTEHQDNDPSPPCIEESDGTSRSIDEIYTEYKSDRNENSYCYQLLQELNEQRQQGILCDVNLVVKGQVFKAHKNILVAGSRYFKTLYCCTPNESCDQVTVTHLDVVAVQGFTVILDFMYSGHLVLTSQNVIEVMSVASYLQMIEIVQGCRGFIKDALNISTKSNTAEKLIGQHEKVKASNRTYRNDKAATIKAEPSSLWVIKSSGSMNNSAIGGLHEERNKYEMEGYSLDMGSLMDQNECYQTNDSTWNQDNFSEYVGKDIQLGLPQDQNPAFSWGNLGKLMMQQTAPRSGRRKNHITRRVVYNVAPKSEEGIEDGLMIQPPMPFSEEGLHEIPIDSATYTAHKSVLNCIQLAVQTGLEQIWTQYSTGSSWIDSASELVFDNRYPKIIKAQAGTSDQYRFGLLHEAHNREAWLNGDALTGSQNKFKCPHCNYIAKYRRTLKRHQLIHTGVRSFACDICGKLFTRREHVKRHSLVHKKDKKYKCMVCKKFFTLAASVGIRHGSRRYGVCLDCSGGERQPKVEQDSMDLMVDPQFFKEEPEELEEQDESGGQEQEEERMVDEDVADEDGGLVDRDEWEDAGVNETYVILDND